MRPAIHLKILHRNRLFRECLASVLSEGERFRVTEVDHAESDRLISALEKERVDAVLIDLDLPEGLAVGLTQQIQQQGSSAKVILFARAQALLSHGDAEDRLLECLAAGADGCVLEESSLEALQTALEKVVGGERFYSPEIMPSVCHRLVQAARGALWQERTGSVDLTPRELEVVNLIAEGLSNKQIARRLSLSLYTVKNHVHNIVEKLQVANRFKAVEYARRRGWLEKLKVMGPADSSG